MFVFALGCEPRSVPERDTVGGPATATLPAPQSLLTPKGLRPALEVLMQQVSRSGRLLSLTALHGQVILQLQSPEHPSEVLEYRYRYDGKLIGPGPVTLLGTGKLQENLFPRSAAAPMIAIEVLEHIASDPSTRDLVLKKLVMQRNLPRSRDIQFRLYFKGTKSDLVVAADKRGRVLGPPVPVGEE